jgi:hypothetical protein
VKEKDIERFIGEWRAEVTESINTDLFVERIINHVQSNKNPYGLVNAVIHELIAECGYAINRTGLK